MDNHCQHLQDILSIEKEIIQQHINNHKWYHGFENENDAIIDFIHRYAWIMREVFCGAMCPHRNNCRLSIIFTSAFLKDISDGEIEEYIKLDYKDTDSNMLKIKLHIIKRDITVHKWLNKIDNYHDAISNFLEMFGWIIYDMYIKSKRNSERE